MDDAIVIGAGPNGLVAANLLADAGWSVVVLEATEQPGGAARSGEVTASGFTSDLFSALYPLGASSPVLRSLDLDRYGLIWRHAPVALAHPVRDGPTALLSQDVEETAASLDAFAPGDGDAWRRLVEQWTPIAVDVVAAIMGRFPPVRAATRVAAGLGVRDLLRFARFALLPVRRFVAEEFRGEGARLLFTGCALHTDLSEDESGGAFFAWFLAMLGHSHGWPGAAGGAQAITDALVARLRAAGGRVECGRRVSRVDIRDGVARGVIVDGDLVAARRAVLADVPAPILYADLVGRSELPTRLAADLRRFAWDHPTVKVDWALSAPIPWEHDGPQRAGCVHLGDSATLHAYSAALAAGELPTTPFLLLGQMSTVDPSRSPAGTESAWAYTHIPAGPRSDVDVSAQVERIEQVIESYAPGFRQRIVGRHVAGPRELQEANPNLVDGAVNGGTAALWQQLVFRPTPGLGRPETHIDRLYLASAGGHPGGRVHGAAGANAARAALLRRHPPGRLVTRGVHRATRWLQS